MPRPRYRHVPSVLPALPAKVPKAKAPPRINSKYYSIALSGLLVLSESMPFLSSVKSNGILDSLRIMNEEFKKLN